MTKISRQYITGEEFAAFRGEVQSWFEPGRVDIVRIYIRSTNGRVTSHRLVVIFAVIGRPASKTIDLPIVGNTIHPADAAEFAKFARNYREFIEGWLTPEVQFHAQQDSARDIWQTTPANDAVMDAIDAWEASWLTHLHGRVHVKARAALYKDIMEALEPFLPRPIVASNITDIPRPKPGGIKRKKEA